MVDGSVAPLIPASRDAFRCSLEGFRAALIHCEDPAPGSVQNAASCGVFLGSSSKAKVLARVRSSRARFANSLWKHAPQCHWYDHRRSAQWRQFGSAKRGNPLSNGLVRPRQCRILLPASPGGRPLERWFVCDPSDFDTTNARLAWRNPPEGQSGSRLRIGREAGAVGPAASDRESLE